MDELVIIERPPRRAARFVWQVVEAVLDSCQSQHTRRAYERALRDFLTWCEAETRHFERATVQRYVATLRGAGKGAGSINQRLAAIRRFAVEAADSGLMTHEAARAIEGVKGAKQQGQRLGHWLSAEEATRLIQAPDAGTPRGVRDRALLAVLVGCGLRRQEAAGLAWQQVQDRAGRAVIVDLRGKGNKLRSVPMPAWCREALGAWQAVAGEGEAIFCQVDRYGHVGARAITAQTVRAVVAEYAKAAELGPLAPHDLRRTFAKLAREGGAELEQIQLSLGHASVATTERYLGIAQNLQDAPGDRLGITL